MRQVGGALYLEPEGVAVLEHSSVQYNMAGQGAVVGGYGRLELIDCYFSDNVANEAGEILSPVDASEVVAETAPEGVCYSSQRLDLSSIACTCVDWAYPLASGGCQCSLGFYADYVGRSMTCVNCAELLGVSCERGRLWTNEGFWRESGSQAEDALTCRSGLCRAVTRHSDGEDFEVQGANCTEGHMGVLCEECEEGYSYQGDTCEQCSDGSHWDDIPSWLVGLGLALGILMVALLILLTFFLPLFPALERRLVHGLHRLVSATSRRIAGKAPSISRRSPGMQDDAALNPSTSFVAQVTSLGPSVSQREPAGAMAHSDGQAESVAALSNCHNSLYAPTGRSTVNSPSTALVASMWHQTSASPSLQSGPTVCGGMAARTMASLSTFSSKEFDSEAWESLEGVAAGKAAERGKVHQEAPSLALSEAEIWKWQSHAEVLPAAGMMNLNLHHMHLEPEMHANFEAMQVEATRRAHSTPAYTAQTSQTSIADGAVAIVDAADYFGNLIDMGLFRVCVSFYQVVASFSDVLTVPWPSSFSAIVNAFSWLTFDIIHIPSVACTFPAASFYSVFSAVLTTYAGVGLFCVAIHQITPLMVSSHRERAARRVQRNASVRMLLFLFMIYPSASQYAVSIFACEDVYGVHRLIADIRIQCYTGQHYVFLGFGVLALLLFPIGIPAYYLWLMQQYDVPQLAAAKASHAYLNAVYHHATYRQLLPTVCQASDLPLRTDTVSNELVTALATALDIPLLEGDRPGSCQGLHSSAGSNVAASGCSEQQNERQLCCAMAQRSNTLSVEERALQIVTWAQTSEAIVIPELDWDDEYNMTDEEIKRQRDVVDVVGFLISDYHVMCWYWGFVEIFRKLFLTSLLIFVLEGSTIQVAVALLFSTCFVLVHVMYSPYADNNVDTASQISQGSICLLLFLGLLLKVDADDMDYSESYGLEIFVGLLSVAGACVPVVIAATEYLYGYAME